MLYFLCGKPSTVSHVFELKKILSRCEKRYYHFLIRNQQSRNGPAGTKELRQHKSCTKMQLKEKVIWHSTCSVPSKWAKPEGYDTGIKIYHPVVKDKVPLILQQEKLAQWYACGPTVYDSAHLGHASSFVRLDIIRRILTDFFDIDCTFVMGVTDIDDKIIAKANETGQSIEQVTTFYELEFFANMASLNVLPPSVVTRVTGHVPAIIEFIKGIEKNGFTYKAKNGSLYFDVKSYGKYGVLSPAVLQPNTAETEAEPLKKNSQDFALWKAQKAGEPYWQSHWGHGRPGWHIECSAMASGIFGSNFDIHSGGEDLLFPHHENELAQSCAYHGNNQWVNYWIHTGHLYQVGQKDKMSKSLKNVITVSDFLKDHTPDQFRMLCLFSNYKKRIEFSPDSMQKAVSTVNVCNNLISQCDSYIKGHITCEDIPEAELYERLHTTRKGVETAFADDFNTPQALANVMRLVKFTNQLLTDQTNKDRQIIHARSNAPVAAVGVYVKHFLKQLGLDLGMKKEKEAETHSQFNKAVEMVVSSRAKIRDFANDKEFLIQTAEDVGIPKKQALQLMKKLYKPLWDASDQIRADILSKANVQINDGSGGSTWSMVDSKMKPTNVDAEDPGMAEGLKSTKKSTSNEETKTQNLASPSLSKTGN